MGTNVNYNPPKLTSKELLEIFPEAKDIIPVNIGGCKKIIAEKEMEIRKLLEQIYSLKVDQFSEWFAEEVVKVFFYPELEKYQKRLMKLERIKMLLDPNKNKSLLDFQEGMEIAKNYPIYELARDKLDLRSSGKNFVSLCPFHNEKTPSFYLYSETNTFYCFGCQEHGDVITLTMALYGISFKEAVVMLKN